MGSVHRVNDRYLVKKYMVGNIHTNICIQKADETSAKYMEAVGGGGEITQRLCHSFAHMHS